MNHQFGSLVHPLEEQVFGASQPKWHPAEMGREARVLALSWLPLEEIGLGNAEQLFFQRMNQHEL